MPKAKPISLHPLSFEEALKAIIRVEPDEQARLGKAKPKTHRKPKSKEQA